MVWISPGPGVTGNVSPHPQKPLCQADDGHDSPKYHGGYQRETCWAEDREHCPTPLHEDTERANCESGNPAQLPRPLHRHLGSTDGSRFAGGSDRGYEAAASDQKCSVPTNKFEPPKSDSGQWWHVLWKHQMPRNLSPPRVPSKGETGFAGPVVMPAAERDI